MATGITDVSQSTINLESNGWKAKYEMQIYDALTSEQQIELLDRMNKNKRNPLHDIIALNNYELLKEYFKNYSDISVDKLAKTFEEIKIKNFPVSDSVELLVQEKLLEFRFCQKKTKSNLEFNLPLVQVRKRINFVSENIVALLKYSGPDGESADERFFLIGRYIAQNINVLKGQLKVNIPWEEMEFCLEMFLSTMLKPNDTDMVFKLVLDQETILSHLATFGKILPQIVENLPSEGSPGKSKKQKSANKIQPQILSLENGLKKRLEYLHGDFLLVKDVYFLNRIDSYLQLAIATNIDQNPLVPRFAILRTLQVMGECLKNISDSVQKFINSAAPENLLDILRKIRNSISHEFRLERRMELEDSLDFVTIQGDLKKIEIEISHILYTMKIESVKSFFKKIGQCDDLKVAKKMVAKLLNFEMGDINLNGHQIQSYNIVSNLVEELSQSIPNKNEKLINLFDELEKVLTWNVSKAHTIKNEYKEEISPSVLTVLRHITQCKSVNIAKRLANFCLDIHSPERRQENLSKIRKIVDNIYAEAKQPKSLSMIIHKIMCAVEFDIRRIQNIDDFNEKLEDDPEEIAEGFFSSIEYYMSNSEKEAFQYLLKNQREIYLAKKQLVTSKESRNRSQFDEFVTLLSNKHHIEVNDLYYDATDSKQCQKFVSEIEDHYSTFLKKIVARNQELSIFSAKKLKTAVENFFRTEDLFKDAISTFFEKSEQQISAYYENRLDILNIIIQSEHECKLLNNKELLAAIEIVVVDLYEMLKSFGMCPEKDASNVFFIDEYSPTLIGRRMRNYLSHGDVLYDILPVNPKICTIANALKLVQDGKDLISKENLVIGGCIKPDHMTHFQENLHIIENVERVFEAAKNGCHEQIKLLDTEGEYSKARDYFGNTALHYAAESDDLGTFEFLLTKLSIDVKDDVSLRTPIQVAVIFGSKNIINYVIEQYPECIERQHLIFYSVRYEQEKVVELLLEHGADPELCSSSGNSVLHVAVTCNKNIGTMKLLIKYGARVGAVNSVGYTPLHDASFNGNPEMVEYLIEKGAIVDASSRTKKVPLHLAVLNCQEGAVLALLKHNASVNAKDECDDTPIHSAALADAPNIMNILLQRKDAEVNVRNKDGATPLHLACFSGHKIIIEMLIEHGARVNICDNLGVTPLHGAAFEGYTECVRVLLGKGADMKLKTNFGRTAFDGAVWNGHKNAAAALLEHSDLLQEDNFVSENPLENAATRGHRDVVEMLLDKSAFNKSIEAALYCAASNGHLDVVQLLLAKPDLALNAQNSLGCTALHAACSNGHVEIVKALVSKKASEKTPSANGRIPLHVAAINGHAEIVSFLLLQGNSKNFIDLKDGPNKTALHLAAERGHNKTILLLLENQANVQGNSEDYTPLHLACILGHKQVVQHLLEYKADIRSKTIKGDTPCNLAVNFGHKHILELFSTEQYVDGTNLHNASILGKKDCVKFILEKGAFVDERDKNNHTPLQVAAFHGNDDVVSILLDKNADIEATDKNMITPLLIAAERGHYKTVEILINRDANVNAVRIDNMTTLHFAAAAGNEVIVNMLLAKKADFLAKNNHSTVLHSAVHSKSYRVVKVILEKIKETFDKSSDEMGLWVNYLDSEGDTPLMWAAEIGSPQITETLLQYGARMEIRNNSGMTALDWAIENNHKSVLDILSRKIGSL